MSGVPNNLKIHSRALLKWAVSRGGRFAATSRPPEEWSARWDMAVVIGLVRRGYLDSHNGLFNVTPLGNAIAAQYEMPVNDLWRAGQAALIRLAEEEDRESNPSPERTPNHDFVHRPHIFAGHHNWNTHRFSAGRLLSPLVAECCAVDLQAVRKGCP